MDALGPLLVMVLFLVGIVLAIALFLAPIKLYSIDKSLKAILEELRIARASRGGQRL